MHQHIQMNSSTTSCIEFHHRQIWFQLLYAIILYTYWINDFNTPDDDDSMNYVFMILTFKHLHFDKSTRLILGIYDMAQHECARLKSIQCTIICLWLFFCEHVPREMPQILWLIIMIIIMATRLKAKENWARKLSKNHNFNVNGKPPQLLRHLYPILYKRRAGPTVHWHIIWYVFCFH